MTCTPPARFRLTPLEDRFTPAANLIDYTFGEQGAFRPGEVSFSEGVLFDDTVYAPDGKIVLGGTYDTGLGRDFLYARLTADGRYDSITDSDGTTIGFDLVDDLPGDNRGNDYEEAITVDSAGRILIAGRVEGPNPDQPTVGGYYRVGVVRLTADGVLDPTFGTGGRLVLDPAFFESIDQNAAVTAIVVLPDGRIQITGTARVIRLMDSGAVDSTYGPGGIFTPTVPAGRTLRDIDSDPSGRVYVTTSGIPEPGIRFPNRYVRRFTTDGVLDSEYGTNGETLVAVGDLDPNDFKFPAIYTTIVCSDGAVLSRFYTSGVIVGPGTTVGQPVTRLRPDGMIDTAFGTNGVATFRLDPATVLADGRIVTLADERDGDGETQTVELFRLTPAGQPDRTFGPDGLAAFGDLPFDVGPLTAVPDASGRVLTTGRRGTGLTIDTSTGLARFNPALNTEPTISDPADVTFPVGTAPVPIPFTVGDPETPADQLAVTADSSQEFIPNSGLVVGGSGANRTLTYSVLPDTAATTTITLTVRDATGRPATSTFTITVTNALPTADGLPTSFPLDTRRGPADLPFTVGDAEYPADRLTVTAVSSDATLLPGATVGGTGANRTLTLAAPLTTVNTAGTATVTVTVTDPAGGVTTRQVQVTVLPPQEQLIGVPQFGAGAGGQVRFYNPDQSVRLSLNPFGDVFTGGVRVAAGDFNRDGIADLVVGTGPGARTAVRVLDGTNGQELFTVSPFEEAFTGGVYVAAGDVTGDGVPELVITPDEGGGPRVRVFNGSGFGLLADFFGIDDLAFRGGARAAVGDVDGDGAGDLIVAAGFGGGPRVAGFAGRTVGTASPRKVFPDFFAFEQSLRNGVFVAVGDIDADGRAEVIAGGGPGGGPRVSAFAGAGLPAGQFNRIADFFAGDPASRGGVPVAVKNLDDDARADVVVGTGPGSGGQVTAYAGHSIGRTGTPPVEFALDAFAGATGSVFVG